MYFDMSLKNAIQNEKYANKITYKITPFQIALIESFPSF